MKFCVKIRKWVNEKFKMVSDSFQEHSLSLTHVLEWHARFKAGRMLLENHIVQDYLPLATRKCRKIRELIFGPSLKKPTNCVTLLE